MRLPRWRLVLPALTALVLTASAAAAIVLTRPSAPLHGSFPPQLQQLLGSRYALAVTPDIGIAGAGWCIELEQLPSERVAWPKTERCVTPRGGAVIDRGSVVAISPHTGSVAGWIVYAVVDRRVPKLRGPDGALIRPTRNATLPDGWRAAVAFSASSDHRRVGTTVVQLTPLDARGHVLAAGQDDEAPHTIQPQNPAKPPQRGCRITAGSIRGLQLQSAAALWRHRLPHTERSGDGLLSCYTLRLKLHGRDAFAALLVNARHPGATPPAIATTRRLAPSSNIWVQRPPRRANLPTLWARRVPGGWLVLRTALEQHAALHLLENLHARV